jgi:hypothetical protein
MYFEDEKSDILEFFLAGGGVLWVELRTLDLQGRPHLHLGNGILNPEPGTC